MARNGNRAKGRPNLRRRRAAASAGTETVKQNELVAKETDDPTTTPTDFPGVDFVDLELKLENGLNNLLLNFERNIENLAVNTEDFGSFTAEAGAQFKTVEDEIAVVKDRMEAMVKRKMEAVMKRTREIMEQAEKAMERDAEHINQRRRL